MDDSKLKRRMLAIANRAGRKAIEMGLVLWYCLRDRDTPRWAKSVLLGDLVYFVSPIDAIPDITPLLGYVDDVALMGITLVTLAAHIKDEHRKRARATLDSWSNRFEKTSGSLR